MSELERAVHIEREGLRDEILRHKHKVSQSEKRLKERTDKHFARNMSLFGTQPHWFIWLQLVASWCSN